jgi:UDP:flavonoid glycosyltransferase YjiC (YdhE family)
VKRVGVQALDDPNLSLPFAHDRNIPVIVTAHPALLLRPADWERWIHVCGPAVLPAPSDWQPSDELNEFITRGLPPVYISFGSCLQADAEALTALAIDAAQTAGLRAIIDTTFEGVFAQPRRMPQVPAPSPPSKSRFRIYLLCVTCAWQGKEQRRVCQAVVSTSIGAVTKESDGIYFVQNLPLAAMLPRCSLFVHTGSTHQTGRWPPLAHPRYCVVACSSRPWQRAVGGHPLRLRSIHI